MKLRKVFHKAPASSARIPRLLTLCAFFAVGIVAGQVAQHAVTGGELADYLRSYAGMVAENGAAQASLLRVAAAYLREPAIIFLLGSCSFGAVAIPLVCAWQGFTLSFAVACFAGSLGQEGVLLSLAAFGLRSVVVLPCTLLLGSAAWETSRGLAALSVGGGKRAKGVTYGKRYWSRFGSACVCLFFGAALELWFIPRILSLLLR